MDLLFVLTYLALTVVCGSTRKRSDVTPIPFWLGGSATPVGACINQIPGRWAVVAAYGLFLLGLCIGGRILNIPIAQGIASGVTLVLWIAAIPALAMRLATGGEIQEATQEGGPSLVRTQYEQYRIHASASPAYAQLCLDPQVSSRLEDTPFSFLKQIPHETLQLALRIAPSLSYQPSDEIIMQLVDSHVQTLQEEVDAHTERALNALAERDEAQTQVNSMTEEIANLKASEEKSRQELSSMRTRARSVQQGKDYNTMALEELRQHRQLLTEELRKVDQSLRARSGGMVSQAGLPSALNPEFGLKKPAT